MSTRASVIVAHSFSYQDAVFEVAAEARRPTSPGPAASARRPRTSPTTTSRSTSPRISSASSPVTCRVGPSRRALRLRHPGLPRHGRGDARRRQDGEPRGDPDGDRGRRLGRRLGGEGSGSGPGRHRRGRLLDRLRRGADARLDRGRQGEGRLCHRLRRRHVRAGPRDRARQHRLGHGADLRPTDRADRRRQLRGRVHPLRRQGGGARHRGEPESQRESARRRRRRDHRHARRSGRARSRCHSSPSSGRRSANGGVSALVELRGITKRFPGARSPTMRSTSSCGRARSWRCSARTAPASRR